ncbi:MAG: hypothetical protein ABI743_10320, partial [bacterium]
DIGDIRGALVILVEVQDELSGNNPGGGAGLPGVDVVEDDFTTFRTIDDFRTFQVITLPVTIALPGVDPVACVTTTPPMSAGTLTIPHDSNVLFDAGCSSDADPSGPESTIAGWEWDFTWDGIPANFVDQTAGLGSANESHFYTSPGSTHLGLRVSDGVGRTSAILDVPITIQSVTFNLTLDAIQDIPLNTAQHADTQRENGASLIQLQSGNFGLEYAIEDSMATGYQTYCVLSTNSGSGWTPGTGQFGFYSACACYSWGFWNKACPNWGTPADALDDFAIFDRNHVPMPGQQNVNAFNSSNTSLFNIQDQFSYSYDIASSRVNGNIFCFRDSFNTLWINRGGPGQCNLPAYNWNGGGSPNTQIDNRPSQVSHQRSCNAGAGGDLHIAYRSLDGAQLRYGRNASGDGLTWTKTDLATSAAGTFSDPAFDIDEGTGAYIGTIEKTGASTWRLAAYYSNDRGLNWQTPLTAGTTFATQPTEVGIAVRTIASLRVIALVYCTASTENGSGEVRLRWTANDGGSWTDQLLSSGADSHWPDFLISRTTGDCYAAWSADESGTTKLKARHGVFGYS